MPCQCHIINESEKSLKLMEAKNTQKNVKYGDQNGGFRNRGTRILMEGCLFRALQIYSRNVTLGILGFHVCFKFS